MTEWRSDERVKLLQQLTEINSGSANVSGVNAVQDIVARELSRLGLELTLHGHPDGKGAAGQFVIGTRRGSSRTKARAERGTFVNLITHADTVFEPGGGFDRFALDEKAGIARGPGVLDDKGGIVVALEGLKRFIRSSTGQMDIRFLCTPTEELGSPGFQELFSELSRESWMALGFEPSLEDGSIIQSRRGNRWYQILVKGREGHAGRDHRRGINAAHEIACKLVELHKLTDYAKDLTVSTGQISGGSKFNVICGQAEARVDVRFGDFETRDRAHGKIESIIMSSHIPPSEDGKGPVSTYELANDCPPFAATQASAAFVAKYLALIQEIEGAPVRAAQSGGAADCNYMSREGLVILDGLGASGGSIHSEKEFVKLASLETRSEVLARFLTHVEGGLK